MVTGDADADRPTPTVWIDAQLPPALASWLRDEYEVEAIHVQDLGFIAASDREIFEAAKQTDVVVVTKDSDFVLLLQQRGPPPQVLWVRSGNTTNHDLRDIVVGAWPKAAALLGEGEPLVEIRRKRRDST